MNDFLQIMTPEVSQWSLAGWLVLSALIMVKRENKFKGVLLALTILGGVACFSYLGGAFDVILPPKAKAQQTSFWGLGQ